MTIKLLEQVEMLIARNHGIIKDLSVLWYDLPPNDELKPWLEKLQSINTIDELEKLCNPGTRRLATFTGDIKFSPDKEDDGEYKFVTQLTLESKRVTHEGTWFGSEDFIHPSRLTMTEWIEVIRRAKALRLEQLHIINGQREIDRINGINRLRQNHGL